MNLDEFKIKWQDVQDSSFEALPAGHYAAKISEAEIHISKKSGNKSVKVVYTLLGRKGVKGRKIFDYYSLTTNAGLGRLKRLLKTLQIDFEEFKDTSMLVGHQIGLELKIETDGDFGEKNRVQKFMEYDDELLSGDQDAA